MFGIGCADVSLQMYYFLEGKLLEDVAHSAPELYQRFFDKFQGIYGEEGLVTPLEEVPHINLPALELQEEAIAHNGMILVRQYANAM